MYPLIPVLRRTRTAGRTGRISARSATVMTAAVALVVSGGLWRSASAGEPQPTAEAMMIRAHAARAEWHEFPGFSADLAVATDGKTLDGRIQVAGDGTVKLTLDRPDGFDWVEPRLRPLVSHRLPPAREREFDVAFADDVQTHPLGRLIRFNEDRLHSVYRVRDDVITEVHRTMGPSRFTISVTDAIRNAEGRLLPGRYSLSWWDVDSGNLTASETVRNDWVRIGQWDLPSRLLSVRTEDDGQREVRQITFARHQLAKGEQPETGEADE